MRKPSCIPVYQWTGRLFLPVFVFSQLFVFCPALYAAPENGVSVTGELVETAAASDVTAEQPADAGAVASTNETSPAVSGTNSAADASATEPDAAETAADTEDQSAASYRSLRAGRSSNSLAMASAAGDTNTAVKFRLNFEDVDIRSVLLYLSDITGETILPENNIKSTITVINPQAVTPAEAKQIIYSILEMSGYTIVKYEHLTKIVKSGDAKSRPIETLQPPENINDMNTEDIIRSQVLYPKHISASQVKKFIDPLVTKGAGEVIIDERTGAVIIIDTGPNIKRLMEVINIIDKVVESGQVDVRIIPMKYADETEMRTLLDSIFNSPALKEPNVQSVTIKGDATASGTSPTTSARPTGRATPPPTTPAVTDAGATLQLGQIKTTASFIAEPRLHALIVISAEQNFPLIMRIIERLDVPTTENDDTVHIYPLQHAEAAVISETLNSIFAEAGASRSTGSRASSSSSSSRSPNNGQTDYSRRSQPTTRSSTSSSSSSLKATGLNNLAGKVEVLFDEPSNSLIIITSPRYYIQVKRLIQKLDQRTPQVFIEALLVEVTRSKDFNLGIGWKRLTTFDDYGSMLQVLDTTLGPVVDEARKEITPGTVDGLSYSFGKFANDGHFDPYFTLQTAEGVKDINVLSAPSVLASNNKVANIRVGQQFPIARNSVINDTQNFTYDYIDIDIELEVTPRINRYREVALEVKMTVRENGGTAYPNDPQAPPIILNRSVTDEVLVQDGKTLVIGGLIKDDFNTSVTKVPLVGDIPIIKHAFRSTVQQKNKTELLVFITPKVVMDMYEGDILTDEMREKMRGANAFVDDRGRRQLYDDVNYAKTQLTIYDDWKEFEKDVNYYETYFRGEKKDEEAVYLKSVWFPKDITTTEPNEPYEGEILDTSDFVEPKQFEESIYDLDGDLPDNDTDGADSSFPSSEFRQPGQPDQDIYDTDGDLPDNDKSGSDSSFPSAKQDDGLSALPSLLARERILVERSEK